MKISIYIKFLLGIITAMISVSLVSLTIFLQLLPPDPVEFRIYPLIHDLEKIFSVEVTAADTYIKTRQKTDSVKLDFLLKHFGKIADSLLEESMETSYKERVQAIITAHESVRLSLYAFSPSVIQKDGQKRVVVTGLPVSAIDSVRQRFIDAFLAVDPGLYKALMNYNEQKSNYQFSIVAIFVVILVITWVIARPYAQSMTRPIRALREGTQKVGEGKYESVPISSKDEIADLTIAFNLMSDKLRKLDEMRMELMSEISHEMRTPLQVIKAGCYSIIHAKDSGPLTQRQRDAVGMIHQATNRINSFINLFLDVAKMESGLMKFNFEESIILDVLNPLLQEAELIAQTRQIDLKWQTEDVPPMRIDKDRFSQAFSNLLSNALKYTPDGGTITIRIAKKADCQNITGVGSPCLRIDVQDTGVGIPEADLGKLFSKFFQAKNVPLVNEKGSGLGLALVKHVVEAHGGKVSVESTVGVGSTFSMYLPIDAKTESM